MNLRSEEQICEKKQGERRWKDGKQQKTCDDFLGSQTSVAEEGTKDGTGVTRRYARRNGVGHLEENSLRTETSKGHRGKRADIHDFSIPLWAVGKDSLFEEKGGRQQSTWRIQNTEAEIRAQGPPSN